MRNQAQPSTATNQGRPDGVPAHLGPHALAHHELQLVAHDPAGYGCAAQLFQRFSNTLLPTSTMEGTIAQPTEVPGIIEWHQIDKGLFYTLGAPSTRCA